MDFSSAAARMEFDFDEAPAATQATGEMSVRVDAAQTAPERLCRDWDALASRASEPNAFAELWFTRAALRHLASKQDVRMIEVRAGNELVGLLPVTLGERYARLPVRHVTNWLHFQAFLGTPLVRAGCETRFWSAILDMLDGADWAPSFLHLNGLVEDGPVHRGLCAAAAGTGRRCDTVHRAQRAMLASKLSSHAYYETAIRKKKRKEFKRLQARLGELGVVETATLTDAGQLESWCDAFLDLEKSGWKGQAGSALACHPSSEAFFRKAVAGAFAAGKLDFLRLDLDGRALAMLVNFVTPPGSFGFKTAFDESYSRFSPGVLLQIENLRLLDRKDVDWTDSCAVENHPMIDSLWSGRRTLVRVTVPLAGPRRLAAFHLCRTLERLSAALRRRRPETIVDEQDDD
jgi:CelD/BcsL family acetyltransferase involved in cellulose biosynthesis